MKSQQVDLHLHTTASDGTWLPQELVAAAQLAGLGSFAVTDHETVANVAATQKYAQE
ncbi:MAG: PHP domain-containing protein, partial [Acidaminococcaceae bacterium]